MRWHARGGNGSSPSSTSAAAAAAQPPPSRLLSSNNDVFKNVLNFVDRNSLVNLTASNKNQIGAKIDDAVKNGYRFGLPRRQTAAEKAWFLAHNIPWGMAGMQEHTLFATNKIFNEKDSAVDWFERVAKASIPLRFIVEYWVGGDIAGGDNSSYVARQFNFLTFHEGKGGKNVLHSVHEPALICKNEADDVVAEYWFVQGKLHREGDEPAITVTTFFISGTGQESYHKVHAWFKDGRLHRDGDLPAVVMQGNKVRLGFQEWWTHGTNQRISVDSAGEIKPDVVYDGDARYPRIRVPGESKRILDHLRLWHGENGELLRYEPQGGPPFTVRERNAVKDDEDRRSDAESFRRQEVVPDASPPMA